MFFTGCETDSDRGGHKMESTKSQQNMTERIERGDELTSLWQLGQKCKVMQS